MRSVVGNRIHADGADIFRHQGFELVFRPFMVEKCAPGVAEERGELRPGIRRAHIGDADSLDARPRRLGIDQVHMPVTSAQIRMARAALNWTVRDLAEATGLHRNTINNIEVGRYAGDPESLAVIETVLTRAGVEFTNGNRPGVRLRKGRFKS